MPWRSLFVVLGELSPKDTALARAGFRSRCCPSVSHSLHHVDAVEQVLLTQR